MRLIRIYWLLLIVILFACLLLSACHQDPAPAFQESAKVPEPGALGVLLVGIVATAMAMRSRRK